MTKVFIVTIATILLCSNAMFCNYYPLDPKSCILKTEGVACQFELFDNSCMTAISTSIGCKNTLNKQACLNQLSDGNNQPSKCFFGSRCTTAPTPYLANLGCSDRLSRYACTSVTNSLCQWLDSKCQIYKGTPSLAFKCSEVYGVPVVAQLCAQIPELPCINNGFDNNYECVDVTDAMMAKLTCDQPGLSQTACMGIYTPNQQCVFKNSKCQYYVPLQGDSCNLMVNKHACLAIQSTTSFCLWKNSLCQNTAIDPKLECTSYQNVNPSVCNKIAGLCLYDPTTASCIIPKDTTKLTCDTKGLSQGACLDLNLNCTFQNGYCESITTSQLGLYSCDMQLNKRACVNLMTKYQFCQWNGTSCVNIFINQNLSCESLTNVNGNVCRAVIKEGCEYDPTKFACVLSKPNDACNAAYINILGCVQITNAQSTCQWIDEQCQTITVVKYNTQCSDLVFANRIACSQTHNEGVGIKRGCYFSTVYSQCIAFDSDNTEITNSIKCTEPGLNQIGCSLITTENQICRWLRGSCVTIQTKVEVGQFNCLSMNFVNAAACALIVFKGEHCKFSKEVYSCISAVDVNNDNCNTPGMNEFGCGAIKKANQSCFYDQIKWKCLNLDLTTVSDTTKALLNTASCTANSPTQDVCVSITKPDQKCAWSARFQACTEQYIGFNQICKNFVTVDIKSPIAVNANVCGAIWTDNPMGLGIGGEANQGYCQYVPATKNCGIYDAAANACTGCCENLDNKGINAHVCSRYSVQTDYCYFNKDLQCRKLTSLDVDITSETLVQQLFNNRRYTCAQVNKQACHLIDWSVSQQCYYDGIVCLNMNFNNYPDLSVLTIAPAITNKYACTGIEAVITSVNLNKYFSYDDANNRCKVYDSSNLITCSETNINMNACTGLTKDDYCFWRRDTFTCDFLDNLTNIKTCSQFLVNQKACNDLVGIACKYMISSDKCTASADYEVDCNYFDTNFTVSQQTCAQITKDGQSCKYDTDIDLCVVFNTEVESCNVPGANSQACYNYTKSYCRWNPLTLTCYEISPVSPQTLQNIFDTLKCTDYLNKQVCLQITGSPCKWDTTKFKCIDYLPDATVACPVNDAHFYNSAACASITKPQSGCIQDPSTYKCKSAPSSTLTCTSFPMNKTACLQSTKTNKCFYDTTKKIQERCVLLTVMPSLCAAPNISLEVCNKILATCSFDTVANECKAITITSSTKCSDLNLSNQLPNMQSCISIDPAVTTKNGNLICSGYPTTEETCGFEKSCLWSSSSYTCSILPLGSGVEDKKKTKKVPVTCPITDPDTSGGVGGDIGGGGRRFLDDTCYNDVPDPQCTSTAITYNVCLNTYSKFICLKIVSAACYFDLTQGGCLSIKGREKLVPSCASANALACTMILNPNVKCETQADTTEYTEDCTIDPKLKLQCVDTSSAGSSCSTLASKSVNGSVCATASDNCYYDGTNCATSAGSANCESMGLSSTSCIAIASCKFENNLCQYTSPVTIPNACADVQTTFASEDDTRKGKICASITIENCTYTSSTCSTSTLAQVCSNIANTIVGQLVCVSCTGDSYYYDRNTMKCVAQSTGVYSCADLNKDACQKKTLDVFCAWNSTTTQCELAAFEVVAAGTVCSDSNIPGCSFVNAPCIGDATNGCTTVSLETNTCEELITKNSNSKGCAMASDACVQNAVTNSCKAPVEGTVYSCTDVGLSKLACLKQTFSDAVQNRCYYKTTDPAGCNIFLSTNADTVPYALTNKYACLAYPTKQAWDPVNNECVSVTMNASDQTCTSFQSDSSLLQFSAKTCSSINTTTSDQFCQLLNFACADLPGTGKCTTLGLNKLACLKKTTDYCQYVSDQCQVLTNLDQDCNATFSVQSCIKLTNRSCYFLTECKSFDFSTVTNQSTAISTTTVTDTFYNPKICATIDVTNAYLVYDKTTSKCQNADVSPLIAVCTTVGINKLACLGKTKNLCQYSSSNGCTTLNRLSLNSYISCDPTVNWLACINFPKVSCKFQNNLCVTIAPTDTCATLIDAQTGRYTCATRTDSACNYNDATSFCVVPADINLACTTLGLNKIACIQHTTTDLCIFDDVSKTCSVSLNHQLSCTDLINDRKCFLIQKPSNYCYFNNNLCSNIPVGSLTTCVKAYKTNALTCSMATNQACSYNSTTSMCENVVPATCLDNPSLNQLACTQNTGTQKCKWTTSCVALLDSELITTTCSSQINKASCINITNPSQFCQFVGNQCQSVLPNPTTPSACTSIININRSEFCEGPIDVACKYDSTNRQCIQVTVAETNCNRGMNRKACEAIDPSKKCQFDGFCFGPDDMVKCTQALTKSICVGSLTLSCEWNGTGCIEFVTTNIQCTDIIASNKQVSQQACLRAKVTNVTDACSHITLTSVCQVTQPSTCAEAQDQKLCTKLQQLPCIYTKDGCILYDVPAKVDTCFRMNGFGSERACLDVQSPGQYCQFKDFQCLPSDPLINTCPTNISKLACTFQINVACFWKVTNTKIYSNTKDYSYGTCTPYVANNEQECSINLSFLACLQVTKKGQFCQWSNGQCNKILNLPKVITYLTFTLINSNTCGLVNQGSVQYKLSTKSCQPAEATRTCLTMGLNREACVNITNQLCKWDVAQSFCSTLLGNRRLLQVSSDPCLFDEVSPLLCQQITADKACAHYNGNCRPMSPTATCTDPGVNKYGCFNITTSPCIWLANQCQNYLPFSSCTLVPGDVNAVTCSLVSEDSCQYNAKLHTCQPSQPSNDCNVLGLNPIGCSYNANCIFLNQKCQSPPVGQVITCEQSSQANYKVCAQAIDKCKYGELNYGCIPSALTDRCSALGLSQLSCNSLEQCEWQDSGCQCQLYLQTFPKCSELKSYKKCSISEYCYFEVAKVKSTLDLTNYLKNQDQGICREMTCEDMDASQPQKGCYNIMINGKLCYPTTQHQCKAATKCSDIISYELQSYPDCSLFSFQGQPCQNNGVGSCQDLNCFNLSQNDCLKYFDHCHYDNACVYKTCQFKNEAQCLQSECDWNHNSGLCTQQIDCLSTRLQPTCENKKEKGKQCAWITNETNAENCVSNGCRYISKTQGDCLGTHIGNQICVLLSDSSCVSCEEITDSCTCLENPIHCQLDRLTQQCSSRSCRYYDKATCPTRCRYLEASQSCQPICMSHYNEYNCDSAYNCKWSQQLKLCNDYQVPVLPEEILLPRRLHSFVLIVASIVMILFI